MRPIVGPRPVCQAVLFNKMAREATYDVVCLFCDDYEVEQPDWANKAAHTMACLPYGYGVGYFADPMYPHFATFPMLSKRTIALNLNGNFLPEFFPFLFGDTWWNEIGVMAGMILPSEAKVAIQSETGHIHKYVDLKLWSELFHYTRPFRAQIAVDLVRAAFGNHPVADKMIGTMPERTGILIQLHASCLTQEFYDKHDRQYGDKWLHPDYPEMKRKAEVYMAEIRKNQQEAA